MNAIVPSVFSAPSTRVTKNSSLFDDLSAGVQGGYGHIGYKGKVWSTRYRGTDTPLMRPDGDGPRNSIEVVVVKSPANLSKIWYESGYVEGSTQSPDCFSSNGLTPDLSSTKKQALACAACPMNAWGSQKKQDGTAGKGKACSDSKRVAIVPLMDLANEGMGGPMLLRVPAASLQDFAAYGGKMQGLGYPACTIGTRISFDTKESYPKFVFEPIRPLTDAEVDLIEKLRDDPRTSRILAEAPEVAAVAAPVNDLPAAFSQPPIQPVAVATPAPVQPVAQVAPVVQPAPAPAPVAQAPSAGGFGGPEAKVTPQVTPQVAVAPEVTVAPPAGAFDAALDDQIDALLPK